MTITAHGKVFEARVCKTCGARDTDPIALAVHEARHAKINSELAGRLRIRFQGHFNPRPVRSLGQCAFPGCDYTGRRVRGYCSKHYMKRIGNKLKKARLEKEARI